MSSQHSSGEELAHGSLGTKGLVLMVLAALAPLTLVVTLTPLVLIEGGVTAPGLYLVAGAIMFVFSVGWMAMSRYVRHAGAFFATVSYGLGRPAGAGAAFVAVLAFLGLQIATYGVFGVFTADILAGRLSIEVPWWAIAIAIAAIITYIAYRGVLVSARLLGIALVLEVVTLLGLAAGVLISGGDSGLNLGSSYDPTEMFSSGKGVSLILIIGAFAGFEAAVNFSEEARGGYSTVRRATFFSVLFIGLFYSVVTWIIVQAYGESNALGAAEADPVGLVTAAFDRYAAWLSPMMEALLIMSMFAALLALHSATNRYLFALGRAEVLPRSIARTGAGTNAPYIAGVSQTAIVVIVVGAWALLGLDPYLQLSLWGTALGVHEVGVWALACVAIVIYLGKHAPHTPILQRVVAPVLAFCGFIIIIVMVVQNIALLTGDRTAVNITLLALGPVVFACGALRALHMRAVRPAAYERLALLDADAAEADDKPVAAEPLPLSNDSAGESGLKDA